MAVKLDWKNKKHLTADEYSECISVYTHIKICNSNGKKPTGKQIASRFNVSPQEIRKNIQNIREHNDAFNENSFLVADNKGYYITKNKKIIRTFINKTHLMAQHKLQQVEQGYKTLGLKGW